MTKRSSDTDRDVVEHVLFDHFPFRTTRLPRDLDEVGSSRFEELWSLHPERFHEITQPFTGKIIPLPRWQQAYRYDYRYTGNVNRALAIPELLLPFLVWAREQFDARLNGLLLNWYDAERKHYIGAHRDSTVGLVAGTPIVTISLGATRAFRLRPMRAKSFVDFEATHGVVFVVPWETNLRTKHEVPHRESAKGRRISITARAFDG